MIFTKDKWSNPTMVIVDKKLDEPNEEQFKDELVNDLMKEADKSKDDN